MSEPAAPRAGFLVHWPEGREALRIVGSADGVEEVSQRLLELLRLHCSFLNGCGYCVAMHCRKAADCGASPSEIDAVCQGVPAGTLSSVDRIALALAAQMTRLDNPGELARSVERARSVFTPRQLSIIGFQIAAINAWNRMAIADGLEAQHFVPAR